MVERDLFCEDIICTYMRSMVEKYGREIQSFNQGCQLQGSSSPEIFTVLKNVKDKIWDFLKFQEFLLFFGFSGIFGNL